MAKRIIAVMLVFFMILGTCEITANAAQYATGTYSTSTIINFRTGPGLNYSKIGMTANGATFQVTKINGSWGYSSNIQTVRGETKAGWVNLNYCKQVDSTRTTYSTIFASVRGKGYSLFQAKEMKSTSFPKGSFVYVWGFVHDAQNNFYMSYSPGKTCNMTLSVYRPDGSCACTYTYNGSDNNWIGLKLDEIGNWKIQSKITGSIKGTNTRTITVTENSTTSSDSGENLLQAKFAESVYKIATAQKGKNYSTYGASKGEAWCGYYVRWILKNAYEQIGYNYQDFVPVSSLLSASKTGVSYQAGGYGEAYSFTNWKKMKGDKIYEGFISNNLANCRPKVGDIVLVETEGKVEGLSNGPDHLGIIIKINADGSFVTSEGNTGVGNNETRVVKEYTYVKGSSGMWHRKGDSLRKVHMICSIKLPN